MTIQSDVEIDRHRQTVDRIANQDCLAETVLYQQYLNRHSGLRMRWRTGPDARNCLNRI